MFVFCLAFYKNESPQYLQINPCKELWILFQKYAKCSFIKQNNFKKYFFLSGIIQWNNLNLNLRNSNCLNIFRNSILKFIAPSANSAFNSHNPKEIEFITRPRIVQSHLLERIFKHSFQDLLNPISNCWLDIESFWLIWYM